MPIILIDDIQKGQDSREMMRMFMDEKEPELVYWLHHTWNAQGRAITYKELREMLLNGDIDPDFINQWQQDYSVFVNRYLGPIYRDAMAYAAAQLEKKRPGFVFDPMEEGITNWTQSRGAAFVTECTDEQIRALRTVIHRAVKVQDVSVDSLARSLRAMVGLNRPQAIANQNFFNHLIQNGASEKKALEKSIKYAAQQHRYRGHMIARTEMAFSFNKGEDQGVRQAIAKGYMGRTVKTWVDSGDDRVCDICRSLHNRTHRQPIEMDAGFGFPTKLRARMPDIDLTPPAHPHCRCVCTYSEVEPPVFSSR